ncbi:MAG: hypothetical protein SPL83_10390 [Succinivibrio sp.]|jgi:hypothetical protein|nr:hypothetical protein [Succinivibrio sp.]
MTLTISFVIIYSLFLGHSLLTVLDTICKKNHFAKDEFIGIVSSAGVASVVYLAIILWLVLVPVC